MILLSHNSALELLRGIPPQVRDWEPAGELPMDVHSTDLASLRGVSLPGLGIRQSQACVLVGRGARESKSREFRTRWFGLPVIPEGLMLQAEDGVYVAGPELCFIQMAQLLSPVGSVVLGCELCGAYSHFSQLISGYYERPPLTSVEKIAGAIERMDGLYGLSRARYALQWVRDGSRSPMETVASCDLFLPGHEGGLAFAPPTLNCRVGLDDEAFAITGTRSCYVDAGWPGQRRGLEYDSLEFHKNPEWDAHRREALQHMGWDIYSINLDKILNYGELLKTVALFADDVPRQEGGPASEEEGAALHRRLLRATRCGMGLEAALFEVPVDHGKIVVHVRG